MTLHRFGGWAEHTVALPAGEWHDVLAGRDVVTGSHGAVRLADVLTDLPVALLTRR